MTTKERTTLQTRINKMQDYEKRRDMYFEILQDMNAKKGSGHRRCSAKQNLEDLISCGEMEALVYYECYIEYTARIEELWSLGTDLANLNFWKK